MASRTLPGPTGRPVARSVRAKCMMFSPRRPAGSEAGVMGLTRGGGELGLHLVEDVGGLAAADLGDVVLVLQQHAQGVIDRLRIEGHAVELDEGIRPVDRSEERRVGRGWGWLGGAGGAGKEEERWRGWGGRGGAR